jgi:hypothetical protein
MTAVDADKPEVAAGELPQPRGIEGPGVALDNPDVFMPGVPAPKIALETSAITFPGEIDVEMLIFKQIEGYRVLGCPTNE